MQIRRPRIECQDEMNQARKKNQIYTSIQNYNHYVQESEPGNYKENICTKRAWYKEKMPSSKRLGNYKQISG